jgi:hypothetical protein
MSHHTEQRLALSRILIVTALREPTWVVLLQRWVKARLQRTKSVSLEGRSG